jgi:hypothetical protein
MLRLGLGREGLLFLNELLNQLGGVDFNSISSKHSNGV